MRLIPGSAGWEQRDAPTPSLIELQMILLLHLAPSQVNMLNPPQAVGDTSPIT
jgi:hypothetical protein